MRRILILTLMCLFCGLAEAGKLEIKNEQMKVIWDKGHLSIWDGRTGAAFLTDANVGQSNKKAKARIQQVKDPKWGSGKAIVIEEASGNLNRIAIFDSLPFAMLQRTLVNKNTNQASINKDFMIEGRVELGVPVDQLKAMSTAGLKPVTEPSAGYVYMTIGDPKSYRGIIVGWLTAERGCGIVFSDYKEGKPTIRARLDYGDLRIAAGTSAKTEILLIGYADDVRKGLETYGEALARQLNVKLPPPPTVYCTWYHDVLASRGTKPVNAETVAANTDFIAERLKPYGFDVIQIDDMWQSGLDTPGGESGVNGPAKNFTKVNPNGPFPKGMKPTADYHFVYQGVISFFILDFHPLRTRNHPLRTYDFLIT